MSANTTTRAPLLTIPEVARRLGLHRDTVYRKIQRGEIPAVRIGRDGPDRFASTSASSTSTSTGTLRESAGQAEAHG